MRQPMENQTALAEIRVADAMHPGLISCAPETPLRTVARMMATYRVHAILVSSPGDEDVGEGSFWGVVSDVDLLRTAAMVDADVEPARRIAATPALVISTGDHVARAAQMMAEHEVSHLIVVEPLFGKPVGVLSTLDVARAVAGFPELRASF